MVIRSVHHPTSVSVSVTLVTSFHFHYYPSCQVYWAATKLFHPCLSLASLWMVPQLCFMFFISAATFLHQVVFSEPHFLIPYEVQWILVTSPHGRSKGWSFACLFWLRALDFLFVKVVGSLKAACVWTMLVVVWLGKRHTDCMLPCCPGTIQQYLGDLSYIVEDATGYIERIWREDIISDYDDNAPPLKVSTKNVLPLSISFFLFVRGGGEREEKEGVIESWILSTGYSEFPLRGLLW